jgi:hypothetical protein
MRSPALKAGLIGAGAMIVIGLVGLIPFLGCISLPLEWLAYIAIGALAAYWLAPIRQNGQGAGQGALAGLIAGLVGGIVRTVLAPASLALSGGSQAIISQLPPDSLQAFRSAGIDPSTFFGPGMMAGFTAVCCLPVGLLLGAALGALGGLIYASAKPGAAAASLSSIDPGDTPQS